eukprot:6261752-Lingulodinium_polyedra.AAC.1
MCKQAQFKTVRMHAGIAGALWAVFRDWQDGRNSGAPLGPTRGYWVESSSSWAAASNLRPATRNPTSGKVIRRTPRRICEIEEGGAVMPERFAR